MEEMILGLLMLSDRTIYELRERIRKGLSLIYSDSMGSIQAALRQLLRKGYVDMREQVEQGRHKKVYAINDAGRKRFATWVNAPMTAASSKHPELGKLYFMGFGEQNNRLNTLKAHILELQKQYEVLCAICAEGEAMKCDYEHNDLFHYQLATARYGRDLMKFNIDWYKALYRESSEGGNK